MLQSEPSLAAIEMLVLHRAPDSTEPYPRAEQLVQRMLFDYPKLPIETDVAQLVVDTPIAYTAYIAMAYTGS